MQNLLETGKVKAIGVSNFDVENLKKLLASAKIKPAVNQVELHPYLPQPALLKFAARENILLTAYSPLGSGNTDPSLLKDPVIEEIAKKHGKNAGQVLINWAAQRGTSVIPKSVHAERIKSNFETFALDQDDMDKIAKITTRVRTCDPKQFWKVELFKGETTDT